MAVERRHVVRHRLLKERLEVFAAGGNGGVHVLVCVCVLSVFCKHVCVALVFGVCA